MQEMGTKAIRVYSESKMVKDYERIQKIYTMKLEELYEVIIEMIPFQKNNGIRILDIGSGPGSLSLRILKKYPKVVITCLDGSLQMLAAAKKMLDNYSAQKKTFIKFNFETEKLSEVFNEKFDMVVSAFAIHHLSHRAKRQLFKEIYKIIETNGGFINGDIVRSKNHKIELKYEDVWARHVKKMVKYILKKDILLESIKAEGRKREEEEGDKPASLEEQLRWLRTAGFDTVECVWKYYCFAVYGGFKSQLPHNVKVP